MISTICTWVLKTSYVGDQFVTTVITLVIHPYVAILMP
jgi:hypothetical protein